MRPRAGRAGRCLSELGISCPVPLEPRFTEEGERLTTCGKEGADVLHCRLATADEHGKSNDREELEPHHKDASLFCPVGGVARADGEKTGDDVRGNRHQLGSFVAVAHVLDDGGEEERDGVEGSIDSDRDEHVHIDLPVLECLEEIFEIELVGEPGSVVFESALDFHPFGLCEKFGSIGVSILIWAIIDH
jgi:hypothetical protein